MVLTDADSDGELVENPNVQYNGNSSKMKCSPTPNVDSDSEVEDDFKKIRAPAVAKTQLTGSNDSESDEDVQSSVGKNTTFVVRATEEESDARRSGRNELLNDVDPVNDDRSDPAQYTALYVDNDGLSQLELRTNCSSSKKSILTIPNSCVVNARFRDDYGDILKPIDVPASVFFGLSAVQRSQNTKELIQKHTLYEIYQRLIWISSRNNETAVRKLSMLLPCNIVDWDANSTPYKEFYENITPCYQIDSKATLSLIKKTGPTIGLPNSLTDAKSYVTVTIRDNIDESTKDNGGWAIVNPASAKSSKDHKESKASSRKAKTNTAAEVSDACTGTPLPTSTPTPTPPHAPCPESHPVSNGVYTEFANTTGITMNTTASLVPVTTPSPIASTSLPVVPETGVSQKRTHTKEWTVASSDSNETGVDWPAGAKCAKITHIVEFHW